MVAEVDGVSQGSYYRVRWSYRVDPEVRTKWSQVRTQEKNLVTRLMSGRVPPPVTQMPFRVGDTSGRTRTGRKECVRLE